MNISYKYSGKSYSRDQLYDKKFFIQITINIPDYFLIYIDNNYDAYMKVKDLIMKRRIEYLKAKK